MMILIEMFVCMIFHEPDELDWCDSHDGEICLENCWTGEFSSLVVH